MPVFVVQKTQKTVFKFSVFDIATDDFRLSTRWATLDFIRSIGGRSEGAGFKVDAALLSPEGLTEREFIPQSQPAS